MRIQLTKSLLSDDDCKIILQAMAKRAESDDLMNRVIALRFEARQLIALVDDGQVDWVEAQSPTS